MLDSTQKKKLLSDVKDRLNITWDNENTDKKLTSMIEDAEIYLNHLLGAECDYSAPGMFHKLFLNYAMYSYNHCEEEFEDAYRKDILTLQDFCRVAAKGVDDEKEDENSKS